MDRFAALPDGCTMLRLAERIRCITALKSAYDRELDRVREGSACEIQKQLARALRHSCPLVSRHRDGVSGMSKEPAGFSKKLTQNLNGGRNKILAESWLISGAAVRRHY